MLSEINASFQDILGLGLGCPNRYCVGMVRGMDKYVVFGLQRGQLYVHCDGSTTLVSGCCTSTDEDLIALTAWTKVEDRSFLLVALGAPRSSGSAARVHLWTVDVSQGLALSPERTMLTLSSNSSPIAAFHWSSTEDHHTLLLSHFVEGSTAGHVTCISIDSTELRETPISHPVNHQLSNLSFLHGPVTALLSQHDTVLAGFVDGSVVQLNDSGDCIWRRQVCGPVADMKVMDSPDGQILCVADGIAAVGCFSMSPSDDNPDASLLPCVAEKRNFEHVVSLPDVSSSMGNSLSQVSDTAHSQPFCNLANSGKDSLRPSIATTTWFTAPEGPSEFTEATVSHGPLCIAVHGQEQLLIGTVSGKVAIARFQMSSGCTRSVLRVESILGLPSHPLAILCTSSHGAGTEILFFGPWMSLSWRPVVTT